ncbi:MAG: hypothetical protein LQ346_006680 [Caloplaca aetnensis]|nr:MAG: hypothetical protein LQ346_006680 [Caloplaca aetnensis]
MLKHAAIESKHQFPSSRWVSAPEAGIRLSGKGSNVTETDQSLIRQAMPYFLRYHDLHDEHLLYVPLTSDTVQCVAGSPHTILSLKSHDLNRAILNLTSTDSEIFQSKKKLLTAKTRQFQGNMFGSGHGNAWWPEWIAFNVTKHNVETHLTNMEIEHTRLSFDPGEHLSDPQRQVLEEHSRKDHQVELFAQIKLLRQLWVDSIETKLYALKESSMSAASRNGPDRKRLSLHMKDVQADLRHAQSFPRPFTAETRPRGLQEVPPLRKYYYEKSPEERLAFWHESLTLEVASNVWYWMQSHIPIQINLESETTIGPLMQRTFWEIADAMWALVVRPRLSGREFSGDTTRDTAILHGSEGARKHSCGEDPLEVYRKFRGIPEQHFSGPNCPGVECILMPSYVTSSGKRKRVAPTEEFEPLIQNFKRFNGR